MRAAHHHFPHLRILARVRNRDHAFQAMARGAQSVFRESFLSSLAAATATLEEFGMPSADAHQATRTFRENDERLLQEQYAIRDDQPALIAQVKKFAEDLERSRASSIATRAASWSRGRIRGEHTPGRSPVAETARVTTSSGGPRG